jgi:hypothetical protein
MFSVQLVHGFKLLVDPQMISKKFDWETKVVSHYRVV